MSYISFEPKKVSLSPFYGTKGTPDVISVSFSFGLVSCDREKDTQKPNCNIVSIDTDLPCQNTVGP